MDGSGATARLDVRRVRLTDPDALRLVEAVQQEYVVRYGGPDETPLDPTVFDDPHGALFLGDLDGEPVVSGGWRLRSDVEAFGSRRAAEIKRMYVVPAARGRGLARRMLVHLEATALAAGAEVMVLETGAKQPEAIALYESSGYERIPGFGHYAWSPSNRCYARPL
jgi:GNAT superfamily N-acetyltransferase